MAEAKASTDLRSRLSKVRSSLNNRHIGTTAACPFGANNGLAAFAIARNTTLIE